MKGQILLTRSAPDEAVVERRRWFFRHPLLIRLTHWSMAIAMAVLLMSGYQIFNAHPALYWGKASHFDTPLLSMEATQDTSTGSRGKTTVLGRSFDTTGVLGLSYDEKAQEEERAFPSWATLPSDQDLATGRRWHFLFAWILVLNVILYLVFGVFSRQLAFRIFPERDQWRGFGRAVLDHIRFRYPEGDEAKRYNVIQKLTYLLVIFCLIPLQVLAGIAMSPGLNSVAPWLLDLLGGRQSARTIHFVVAHLLLLFVLVHVFEVLVSGFWNNMRGMVTGWFVIERKRIE